MRRADFAIYVAVGITWAVAPLLAEDWPQWRGADRLAVWYETGVVEALPDELTFTWRVPLGSGYSGPAVADGRVFITDWREDPDSRTLDGTERALALDEHTGEVLWTHEWTTSYRMLSISYAIGPRATPTVDGDRVYVVGATGRLFCLDVETGAIRWQKDFVAEYDTSVPTWGITSAPLVDGDRLIHGGWRQARRARHRVRQANGRRDLACPADRGGNGLHATGDLRGGRCTPIDHLAPDRARFARSEHRRGILAATVGMSGWA